MWNFRGVQINFDDVKYLFTKSKMDTGYAALSCDQVKYRFCKQLVRYYLNKYVDFSNYVENNVIIIF